MGFPAIVLCAVVAAASPKSFVTPPAFNAAIADLVRSIAPMEK